MILARLQWHALASDGIPDFRAAFNADDVLLVVDQIAEMHQKVLSGDTFDMRIELAEFGKIFHHHFNALNVHSTNRQGGQQTAGQCSNPG